MMNILTIQYCIEKCNTIFDNSLLKLFPPPLVHLVQCFPQPDDGIALAPAALFFVRHHAVADAAELPPKKGASGTFFKAITEALTIRKGASDRSGSFRLKCSKIRWDSAFTLSIRAR